MIDVTKVEAIHRRLKRAWMPFFTRFGQLTLVQIETIPKILDGANVVVASPTASGKTESVIAPVSEHFLAECWEGMAILYVVPTRALANDTLARIEGPLGDMGLTAALKHGDNPSLPADSLPNCLITTPESLDSLICRCPQAFATLQTAILDEIHLLDNTCCGDHLRLLLWRLRKLVSDRSDRQEGHSFSTDLLSATLSAPHQIARRYTTDFEVVTVASSREIDYYLIDSHQGAYDLARARGWRKLLIFCNLRESVEQVAADLAPLWTPYPVMVHHGSLNRRVREEAETVMKEADIAVCVATSTLEIGIDIGDVDLIVLAEAPWSISALLQHIGRGNRRAGRIHAAAVATTEEEEALLSAMFKMAATGMLPAESYAPDPSVAVQQICSYLYQHPQGASEAELLELVSPLCLANESRRIWGHLQQRGFLEWYTGRGFASPRLMGMGAKGYIPDAQTCSVIDVDSGGEIGTISGVFDNVFILGQRSWQIVSQKAGIIKTRRFHGEAETPFFERHKGIGAFHHLLPSNLKR